MDLLQRFVSDLLECEGALVEAVDPEGLAVMSPAHLQQALRIPEFCRLGFGAALPDGAQRVAIESDWLERFGSLLGERGRHARRVLPADNGPLSDAARMLEHELQLGNATFRFLGARPAWTRYLVFDFRFTALSDEKRDGLLRLGVNLATGALLDGVLERLAPWLSDASNAAATPEENELPPDWDRQRLLDLVDRAVGPRLERLLEPFVASLRRRLGRDQERMYGYHNDLHRDALRRMAGLPEKHDGRLREQQRSEAIAREYRARLDDLGRKYALRVVVEWVQTLDLAMPVQRLNLLVRRRKGERAIELDWNPLARRLEIPSCEFDYALDRRRLVCDDSLHLVSPAGLDPCPGCGKPYCRACHRNHCPKCGQATPSAASLH